MKALRPFLYILFRDHLSLGVGEEILESHVQACRGKIVRFSNTHLIAYVDSFVKRLADISADLPSLSVDESVESKQKRRVRVQKRAADKYRQRNR